MTTCTLASQTTLTELLGVLCGWKQSWKQLTSVRKEQCDTYFSSKGDRNGCNMYNKQVKWTLCISQFTASAVSSATLTAYRRSLQSVE